MRGNKIGIMGAVAAMLAACGNVIPQGMLRGMARRGRTSKPFNRAGAAPHQGAKECQRRLRQLAAGQIRNAA